MENDRRLSTAVGLEHRAVVGDPPRHITVPRGLTVACATQRSFGCSPGVPRNLLYLTPPVEHKLFLPSLQLFLASLCVSVSLSIDKSNSGSNVSIRIGAMSTPAEFYNSLPPISKGYGTLCLLTTVACQLGILPPASIALYYPFVLSHFQVWRLLTNFFFLGKFSINFGIRLLMIARYGVQLERGPFDKRTADFLWMMMFGAFSLLAFYLPWAMLALDVIFGSPLMPDLLGIIAGHLYYFLTVLHPLAGGKNILKTPNWVHRLVARWAIRSQAYSSARPNDTTAGVAFRGRSYRLNR